MLTEILFFVVFVWLIYWIDRERKLNGRPGIPVIGTLFDSVSINVIETIDRSVIEKSTAANKAIPKKAAKFSPVKPEPPPSKLATEEATPTTAAAAAAKKATTEEMVTNEKESPSSNTPSKDMLKKKKHKKSQNSKNRKSKGKKKSKNTKKTSRRIKQNTGAPAGDEQKEPKKEEQEESELTPDTSQGTTSTTDDPKLGGPKEQPKKIRKEHQKSGEQKINKSVEESSGSNPTDASVDDKPNIDYSAR